MTFIFYQISDFSGNLRNPVEKKSLPTLFGCKNALAYDAGLHQNGSYFHREIATCHAVENTFALLIFKKKPYLCQ